MRVRVRVAVEPGGRDREAAVRSGHCRADVLVNFQQSCVFNFYHNLPSLHSLHGQLGEIASRSFFFSRPWQVTSITCSVRHASSG